MSIRLDPTFRFHLKCALWIALLAAAATLIGATYFRLQDYDRLVETQRGSDAETRRLQHIVFRRLEEMQLNRDGDLAAMEAKIKALADQQSRTDRKASVAATKAPFSIESVLSSIVELICIDNVQRDIYYTGSGTVIADEGLIITNQHILASDDGSLIRYCGIGFTSDIHQPPKIEYVAAAVAVHAENDLALLKIVEHIDGNPLPGRFPAVSLADAKTASLALSLGDPIFIGGYPGIGADTFTFTQGVVSGRVGDQLIKTSALIDSGTSGGAAFDAEGTYVGVPTAAARGDIGGSLGYLIGANVIDEFLADYAEGKNAVPKDTKK